MCPESSVVVVDRQRFDADPDLISILTPTQIRLLIRIRILWSCSESGYYLKSKKPDKDNNWQISVQGTY